MRILIIANSDIGLYKFRRELIEELIKRNNELYIAAPEGEFQNEIINLGCRYLATPLERR